MSCTAKIKEKISELEKEHDIRILFACESGSRAWGFESPDSDYDARFIYAHRQEWYLSVYEKRDVIELPVDSLLDINGWDLRKTLRLIYKHNAVIYEWMQSPIVYAANEAFLKGLWHTASIYFSPKATLHHYLNPSISLMVKELVHLKREKDESYQHPCIPDLEHFIKEGISSSEALSHSLFGSKHKDDGLLNSFFRKTLVES